MVKRVQ